MFHGILDEQEYTLYEAARVPIKRHTAIQGEANPFDPAWERYFEKRLDAHMGTTLKGKQWLFNLWQVQNGLCPICNQLMTKKTGWQSHWIVWRSKGGPDTQENRVLLHPSCHLQLHSQGLSVTKPRPVNTTGAFERLEPDE